MKKNSEAESKAKFFSSFFIKLKFRRIKEKHKARNFRDEALLLAIIMIFIIIIVIIVSCCYGGGEKWKRGIPF